MLKRNEEVTYKFSNEKYGKAISKIRLESLFNFTGIIRRDIKNDKDILHHSAKHHMPEGRQPVSWVNNKLILHSLHLYKFFCEFLSIKIRLHINEF